MLGIRTVESSTLRRFFKLGEKQGTLGKEGGGPLDQVLGNSTTELEERRINQERDWGQQ